MPSETAAPEMPEELPDAPPTDPRVPPVVGLGASAGGIQALRTFFEHMPANSGQAFVVILHLSPDHQSSLAEILQQVTAMPVTQVTERVPVEPNRVYVIPPTKHLSIADGHLSISDLVPADGRHMAIDLFFRTMAETQGQNATAIVLSGAGSDGALGLSRVKEQGGLTIVQDLAEAEYDSMPRSALLTGLVDLTLPVAEIPERLLSIRRSAERAPLSQDGDSYEMEADALRELFAILRVRTGHDFSNYKRSTMLRRIDRRLQVHSAADLAAYVAILRDRPSEVQALLRDLLISVTNFFRDREVFDALALQIRTLFEGKHVADHVRVWVAGCATGEEAYSLAMLLREYATRLSQPPSIQIFATDIDEDAITAAREGFYLENIVADVDAQRLQRFFTPEQGGYRVKKELRDMVLFATHNLLRDPPFSRLDLVTCRNLLIYLEREVQERVLELFHFVLRPDGKLMLGSSESAESVPSLFTVLDKKNRIYTRRVVSRAAPSLPAMPLVGAERSRAVPASPAVPQQSLSFGELHQQLLEEYAAPSLIINEAYEIVHLSDRVGRFLQFGGGEPSYNLLKIVHPDLRIELRTALFRAVQRGRPSEALRVPVRLDSQLRMVNIFVRPARNPASSRGFMLVILDDVGEFDEQETSARFEAPTEPMVRQLDEELQRMRAQLRVTIEQYETSTEELKASNEELQAMNEELRSSAEELETSKEELQSVNEELITVNQELKNKVDEISRINSDLQNLMASTDIGTIFLDRELRVNRFTPRAQELFNLIPTDVNRPLAHLTHQLSYDELIDDAARVLITLTTVVREVQHADGRWFLARLLPYRTSQDMIDGVVLTFVDISMRREAEEALRQSQRQLLQILERMPVGVLLAERDGRITFGSRRIERLFGGDYPRSQSIEEYRQWRAHTADGRPYLAEEMPIARALLRGEAVTGEEMHFPRPDGASLVVSAGATPIRDEAGEISQAVLTFEDITPRKQVEEELRQAQDALEARVQERTRELEAANVALQIEVLQRREAEVARQEVLRQLVGIEESERRRISRELHDQLGQQITALLLGLETLKASSHGRAQALERIEQLQGIMETMAREVHQFALDLRPTTLDDLGLVAALGNVAEEWSHRVGIEVAFHTRGMETARLPAEVETTIFRVVLEALTNVLKHADASRVSLILEWQNDHAVAIVEDNGRGFDVDAWFQGGEASRRLGLLGMQERVAIVGGTLTVESSPGSGSTIFVRIPLPPSE